MSHTGMVQAIYEASGRGDVPAILDRLDDVIESEAHAAGPTAPGCGMAAE